MPKQRNWLPEPPTVSEVQLKGTWLVGSQATIHVTERRGHHGPIIREIETSGTVERMEAGRIEIRMEDGQLATIDDKACVFPFLAPEEAVK
jgi:hypothetical protein